MNTFQLISYGVSLGRSGRRATRVLLIMAAVLLMSCSANDEEMARASMTNTVQITVTAITDGCVPDNFIMIALVDKDDKFESGTFFECKTATRSVDLLAGDELEIRMYSAEGKFDKSIRYNITVTQNVTNEFKDVDYTGIKYTIK